MIYTLVIFTKCDLRIAKKVKRWKETEEGAMIELPERCILWYAQTVGKRPRFRSSPMVDVLSTAGIASINTKRNIDR